MIYEEDSIGYWLLAYGYWLFAYLHSLSRKEAALQEDGGDRYS